jgi:hypothetical protein
MASRSFFEIQLVRKCVGDNPHPDNNIPVYREVDPDELARRVVYIDVSQGGIHNVLFYILVGVILETISL